MPPTGAAVLVVMCRRPAMGVGKQRLAQALGPAGALAVAELLLATTLEDAADWPGPVILAPASAADTPWARSLLAREHLVIAQPPGNLGVRINAVDRAAREQGAESLVFIGTDAPGLGQDYYAKARNALADHDAVLGPAVDGGVTLMGARRPWPDLADLPWSTAGLGAALASACMTAGLHFETLDTRADVDVPADLARVHAELASDWRPARRELWAWLDRRFRDGAHAA